MPEHVHLARLESPSQALRVACGAWRTAGNWTTLPELVSCPLCRRAVDAAHPARAPLTSPAQRLAPAVAPRR
jgi:hypothetical protein